MQRGTRDSGEENHTRPPLTFPLVPSTRDPFPPVVQRLPPWGIGQCRQRSRRLPKPRNSDSAALPKLERPLSHLNLLSSDVLFKGGGGGGVFCNLLGSFFL